MSASSSLPLSLTPAAAGPAAGGVLSASARTASVPPHLNSPAAGSDPAPSSVLPSSLRVRPPQPTAPAGASHPAQSSAPPLRVPPLPHWFVVFYAVIKDTDGRDKALKALQYGMRYVRWLMKQSPHRTQQAAALMVALLQLATAHSLPSSLGKQHQQQLQQAADRAVVRLPSAATSTSTLTPTGSATVHVPLPFHVTVPLSLVDQLIAAIAQRLDLLSGTFSTIRKGIRLFKWCYTVPAAYRNYHKFIHEYHMLQQYYKATQGIDKAVTEQQQPPVMPLHVPGLPPLPLLSTVELSNSVLAIVTDMSDDVDWYSKHRLLPASWNATAARATIVLWFVTVVIDLALSTRAAAIQHRQLQEAEAEVERATASTSSSSATSSGSSGTNSSDSQQLPEAARAQLAAVRAARSEALYGSVLTWLKFFFDFGVALPSVLQQQTEREGLVQAMGCLSALVATYKLVLAVK